MDSLTLNQYSKTAEKAAHIAGKLILGLRGSTVISEKSVNNLVTEADYKAQEAIIRTIRESYPDHSIIAEEKDLTAKRDAEHLWIIDPLDGTNNFAHNIPHYCVSIAYSSFGQVMTGVVFDPERKEMFTAVRNEGAHLNKTPIQVSIAKSLQDAVIATGFYYDRGDMMRKTLDSIEKLFESNIHGMRRFGSAALDLCWVACGRFDAYFEYNLSVWDFAAGMLILEEAGGKLNDQKGEKLDLNSSGIAVSNGKFHDRFLEIVSWNS